MVTSWERADLLAPVYDVYWGFFLPMRYPGSGVVMIVSFPDFCCLSYFIGV